MPPQLTSTFPGLTWIQVVPERSTGQCPTEHTGSDLVTSEDSEDWEAGLSRLQDGQTGGPVHTRFVSMWLWVCMHDALVEYLYQVSIALKMQ